MGSVNCCKKPEEILIDEIKNNGEGDKINVLDQDSYPQDTEYVLKANMNPEEENISNQKLYEQEGSPRIDGAYEVAINESSPVQYKQVEESKQNEIQSPINEHIEKEPQNLNQYSPEELAAYQNQNQIQRNANVYEEEIDQYNQPDDTPNKKNVEEINMIKQNKEIQQPNISNISNTGAVDLAVLTSQKSAAPINTLSQVVQTPLTNNKAINIQQNMIQPEQGINNQIQVKEPEEGEDLNKYFQIPTSLAKSKTTMPSNIGIQKLIQQNQGNVASVIPLEGNDDINKYFTQISTTQQNQNLTDKELLNKYFTHAVSGEINPQNIVNMKQPQTTTTTTITKTNQNLPINDINNNYKQVTTTTTTKTTGNVDLRNMPSALTNSEIKRIVDMKDLPTTFGSNDINNFQQKTTTTTTTTKTTENIDLNNIPSALTNSEIKKIVDMKDLPNTFGSNDINNFQQKTTTTTTTTKTTGNADLRNIPSALTNSEVKRIVDMKDLPTTFGSNDIKNFNQKTTTTTTTTKTTGNIQKALTPVEIQKIINMKDLPETIGSSTMTNVKKTTVTTTTNVPGNNINNSKPITTTTKTEITGSIPKALTQEEIQKIINMKDLPETIGSSSMTNVKKTTYTNTSPVNIDLKQFGLEQNPSMGPITSEPIDLKQFGLEPTKSTVSNKGNKQVTTVTKTVQNTGVPLTEDYSKYFQNIQYTNSNPIDLQQFGLENNASNISNVLQGSNITFKQPGQSLASSKNNPQNIISASSTPIITNDYNQYFKTANTITTTGNQRGVTNSTAVNPTYNYTYNTPYTKTATTTTTTKTTGIPVSSATSYVTNNYTLPTNYTANKITSTKVTKSTYGVPIQTTGYNYNYSYNIPTTTTTTTTIKK
ncbi:MAG: hypothetical protein IKQ33_02215 [Clostridia bacterium]|nr:hypothetical protein [Clostridia bacterium]